MNQARSYKLSRKIYGRYRERFRIVEAIPRDLRDEFDMRATAGGVALDLVTPSEFSQLRIILPQANISAERTDEGNLAMLRKLGLAGIESLTQKATGVRLGEVVVIPYAENRFIVGPRLTENDPRYGERQELRERLAPYVGRTITWSEEQLALNVIEFTGTRENGESLADFIRPSMPSLVDLYEGTVRDATYRYRPTKSS
jgi:hypothetical protein